MAFKKSSIPMATVRVGDMTFYWRNGRMVGRVRHNAGKGPQVSPRQINVCSRWSNLVNFWRAFGPQCKPQFECNGKGRTDYNAFVSHGMHAEPVYLTRWQTRNGACVVNSVRVSEGTLRSIAVSDDGTAYATDIALGRLTLDDGTTVGQLATAIVCNNDDFCFNDALWFYVAFQRENPATGLPEAEVQCVRLALDPGDGQPLWQGTAERLGFVSRGGVLAAASRVEGGMAWVHLRKGRSGLKRSTQHLVCDNPLLARMGSEEALAEACRSYGCDGEEPFLTPNDNPRPPRTETNYGETI